MNGKKAKRLRKEAMRARAPEFATTRYAKAYEKVNMFGQETHTRILAACHRKTYHNLKKFVRGVA